MHALGASCVCAAHRIDGEIREQASRVRIRKERGADREMKTAEREGMIEREGKKETAKERESAKEKDRGRRKMEGSATSKSISRIG